jgi:hypothetical protein
VKTSTIKHVYAIVNPSKSNKRATETVDGMIEEYMTYLNDNMHALRNYISADWEPVGRVPVADPENAPVVEHQDGLELMDIEQEPENQERNAAWLEDAE